MTAITIWRNDEVPGNPSLWAVADSKVSTSTGQSLISDAAKILSVPVICRRPGNDGFFSEIYFVHTFGYCFAGSTLMGQNAYLAITPLLSNLISQTSYIPSLADVSQHILAYLRLTFTEYRSLVGHQSFFEVALFGFCYRSQRLEIFHIRPALHQGLWELEIEAHQNLAAHDFVYLGDDRVAMQQAIRSAFTGTGTEGYPISRAPRTVIQQVINGGTNPAIGGDLQLSIADRYGLRPFASVKPRIHGQPEAYLCYLGHELSDDIATVGQTRVAPMAML